MRKRFSILLNVALIAEAFAVINYAEVRTVFTKYTLITLYFINFYSVCRRLWKARVLGQTPSQIYKSGNRPKISLLECAGILLGGIAMIMID